jgi:hypothetical protein
MIGSRGLVISTFLVVAKGRVVFTVVFGSVVVFLTVVVVFGAVVGAGVVTINFLVVAL